MLTLAQLEALRVIGSAVNHIIRDARFNVDDDGELFITERDRHVTIILRNAAERIITEYVKDWEN